MNIKRIGGDLRWLGGSDSNSWEPELRDSEKIRQLQQQVKMKGYEDWNDEVETGNDEVETREKY